MISASILTDPAVVTSTRMGRLYNDCMDTTTIDSLGLDPLVQLAPIFDMIQVKTNMFLLK